ncbi:MAG: hypothetical protein ACRDRP_09175 [Pseudonocardiaceae bacterium]
MSTAPEMYAHAGGSHGLVLACVSCQEAWQLTAADFESGATGCRHCGE